MEFKTVEDIKTFLAGKYNGGYNFGTDVLLKGGQFKLMGFCYDFRPWLQKYLVEHGDGSLSAAWAPNKTALRKTGYYPRSMRILVYPKA